MSRLARLPQLFRRAAAFVGTAALLVPSALSADTTGSLGTAGTVDHEGTGGHAGTTPASAQVVDVNLASLEGRAPFSAAPGPGQDTSPTNGIVRTNDTINYAIGVVVGALPVSSVRVHLALPAGVQMTSLPAHCLPASSSLSPAAATSTTWNLSPATLAPQVVECTVEGPFLPNTTTMLDFETRVLPGDWSSAPAITASARLEATTEQGPAQSPTRTVSDVVTQTAKYDVQVMDMPYMQWDARYNRCMQAEPAGMTYNLACLNLRVPVQITVPDSGRGSLPMDPATPYRYSLDLTLDGLFGAGTRDMIAQATGLAGEDVDRFYGARLAQCSVDNPYDVPGTRLGTPASATTTNAVRDSGTTTCTVDGAPAQANPDAYGKRVTMSVTGMDSTAFTTPTRTLVSRLIEPTNAYGEPLFAPIYSRAHLISIPTETLALVEDGPVQDRRGTFEIALTATPDVPTIGNSTANDTNTRTMSYENTQRVGATFTGSPAEAGTDRVTPPIVFNPDNASWHGPAGPATFGGGDGVLLPDQVTYATSAVGQNFVPGTATYSSLVCQALDTDLVHLVDPHWAETTTPQQALGPTEQINTGPAFLSGFVWDFRTFGLATASYRVDEVMPHVAIRYGIGGAVGSTSLADCSDVTWFDTAEEAAAAAGDTTAGDGIYEGITHVQLWAVTSPNRPETGAFLASTTTFTLAVPVALKDAESAGGLPVGTWSGHVSAPGTLTVEQLEARAADGTARWVASDYVKNSHTGHLGDRVTVTSTLATLRHEVTVTDRDGRTSTWGPSESWNVGTQTWAAPDETQIPRVEAGSVLTYTLTPQIPDATGAATYSGATIEVCLPANVQFLEASVGGVSVGGADATTFPSELTCDTTNANPQLRHSHLVFALPEDLVAGEQATPLTVRAQVLPTSPTISATEGVPGLRGGLISYATLAIPGVTTEARVRTSATRIHVDSSRAFRVSTTAVAPFVTPNPQGWALTERTPRWDLLVTNPASVDAVDLDVIDVLPRQGEPSGEWPKKSAFSGSYSVPAPQIVSGPEDSRILYTSNPAVTLDPNDTSVTWCAPGTDGSWEVVLGDEAGTCPTTRTDPRTGTTLFDGVSALRMQASSLPAGEAFHAIVSIVPHENATGDQYVNQAGGTLGGFDLGPARQATVRIGEGAPAAEVGTAVQILRDGQPVAGTAVPGDRLAFTIDVLNAGNADFDADLPAMMVASLAELLDDADIGAADLAADIGTVTRVGDQIHWWGPLPTGETARITLTLPARAGGDGRATARVHAWPLDDADPAAPGAPTPPTGPVVLPGDAQCEAATCATATAIVENLTVTHAVTGATGRGGWALPGDELVYTVTATNTSTSDRTAENPAIVLIDRAGTSDDGEYLGASASLGSVERLEDALRWSGPIPARQSVTITYRVRVVAGGDGQLVTEAVAMAQSPGTDAGPSPEEPTPIPAASARARTSVQVSNVAVTKVVSGASGPRGSARHGDVLTYTITATNTSALPRGTENPVVVADLWAGVRDDAEIDEPQASSGEVTSEEERAVWEVALEPGETATLTYTARVTGGGDVELRNLALDARAQDADALTAPSVCREPECVLVATAVDRDSLPSAAPGATPGDDDSGAPGDRGSAAAPGRGSLARTGASVGGLILAAGALTAAGWALHRRHRREG